MGEWVERLVSKRSFSLALALVVAIVGSVLSWVMIPVEIMPKENAAPFLFLRVDSPYQGPPEKLELALTIPVERALRKVPNLEKTTTSTNSKGASVSLYFKPRTNIEVSILEIGEALDELIGQGILTAKGISVSRFNPEAQPVIRLSVNPPSQSLNPVSQIQNDLQLGLETIAEVSKAEVIGLEPTTHEFHIDSKDLGQHGMDFSKFSASLQIPRLRATVGSIQGGPDSPQKLVTAKMELTELSALRKLPLCTKPSVSLADIAQEQVFEKWQRDINRNNGQSTYFIDLYNKDRVNLFDLKKNVVRFLERETAPEGRLAGFQIESVYDRTNELRDAIDDVFASLYQAVFITFVVVFIFLRRWKETALISLTIPLTLLLTVLFLYARGLSLNILSLSGLILCIGMVVDNAILVVERSREISMTGLAPRQSAAQAAGEVTLALVLSTITNAVIFLPLVFLPSGDAFTDILRSFQTPILASLVASLVVSLLFLPLWIAWTAPKQSAATEGAVEDPMGTGSLGFTGRAAGVFRRILTRKHRVAAASVLIVCLTVWAIKDIREADMGEPRDPYSRVSVRFGPEVPEADKKSAFEELESFLLARRKTLGVRFIISDFSVSSVSGTLQLYPEKRGEDSDETLAKLDERVGELLAARKSVPGIVVSSGYGEASVGGKSSNKKSMKIYLQGSSMARTLEIAGELKKKLVDVAGVDSVRTELEDKGGDEVVLAAEDLRLKTVDLSVGDIAKQISTKLRGGAVPELYSGGRPVNTKIIFHERGSKKWSLENTLYSSITGADGKPIYLSDLGNFEPGKRLMGFSRKDGKVSSSLSVVLKAGLNEAANSKARSEVRRIVTSSRTPEGFRVGFAPFPSQENTMAAKSSFIIWVSAILIYLILGGMFESFFVPISIILSIPLALVFGVFGLVLLGMELDVMARLSLVILVGIGVNSAIILIDLITSLRAKGFTRAEAIAKGCADRIQSIAMTTAIQVIGVLPVALGSAKIMGISYSTLGVTIISGMLFSTVITLVVLPVSYELFDDLEQWIKSRLWATQSPSERDRSDASPRHQYIES